MTNKFVSFFKKTKFLIADTEPPLVILVKSDGQATSTQYNAEWLFNVDLKQFKHFSLVSREGRLSNKAASFWAEFRLDILNHIVPGGG